MTLSFLLLATSGDVFSAPKPAAPVTPAKKEAPSPAIELARRSRADFEAVFRRDGVTHRIDRAASKSIETTLTHTFRIPDCMVTEWILFAAMPLDGPAQEKAAVTIDPKGEVTKEASPLGRPVLRVRIPVKDDAQRHDATVRLTHKADLFARRLVPLKAGEKPPAVPPLRGALAEMWLTPAGQFDFDAADFQAWLDRANLRPVKDESDLTFAKRAFVTIEKQSKYKYVAEMNRRATAVCAAGESDCGGLNGLYVATLRAAGIPARQCVGRWAESEKPGQVVGEIAYHQEHVKAEFFASGIGWVPVDVSSGVLWDKSDEGLRYFGRDPGDFLTLHYDNTMEVDTARFGQQSLAFLQGAAFWVTGEGKVDGWTETVKWEVKEVRRAEK